VHKLGQGLITSTFEFGELSPSQNTYIAVPISPCVYNWLTDA